MNIINVLTLANARFVVVVQSPAPANDVTFAAMPSQPVQAIK